VDAETAQAFNSARDEERKKIRALLGLWLRDQKRSNGIALTQIMDEIGRKAQARGLTPEILESILRDE
jgi:hypothetical protein